jgi:hypothetical protein
MFDQLLAEIEPSLTKGRHNNNNKAKCIPGGTLRVLAGKNVFLIFRFEQQICKSWCTKMAKTV